MYGLSTTITPGPEQIFKRHSSTQRTWQAGQFGKLFQYSVDSPVFAQPLVISNVTVPGKGIRNVLYLATADNTIYAYDADDPTIDAGQPIWKVRFSDPAAGVETVLSTDVTTNYNYSGPIGITGTPVMIKPAGRCMWLHAPKTVESTTSASMPWISPPVRRKREAPL